MLVTSPFVLSESDIFLPKVSHRNLVGEFTSKTAPTAGMSHCENWNLLISPVLSLLKLGKPTEMLAVMLLAWFGLVSSVCLSCCCFPRNSGATVVSTTLPILSTARGLFHTYINAKRKSANCDWLMIQLWIHWTPAPPPPPVIDRPTTVDDSFNKGSECVVHPCLKRIVWCA